MMKQRVHIMSMIKIYCELDGVLTDWESVVTDPEPYYHQMEAIEKLHAIHIRLPVGFWSTVPWSENGERLWPLP